MDGRKAQLLVYSVYDVGSPQLTVGLQPENYNGEQKIIEQNN